MVLLHKYRKEIYPIGGPVKTKEIVQLWALSILPIVNVAFLLLLIIMLILTIKDYVKDEKQKAKRFTKE
jgi:hypothetical protein